MTSDDRHACQRRSIPLSHERCSSFGKPSSQMRRYCRLSVCPHIKTKRRACRSSFPWVFMRTPPHSNSIRKPRSPVQVDKRRVIVMPQAPKNAPREDEGVEQPCSCRKGSPCALAFHTPLAESPTEGVKTEPSHDVAIASQICQYRVSCR